MPPRSRITRADLKRARAEVARLAALCEQRHRRGIIWAALIAVGLAVVTIVTVVIVTSRGGGPPRPTTAQSAQPAGWGLPADPGAAAAKAGLPMIGQEVLDVHYHAYLDVIVRGQTVTVPAQIGIDTGRK